MKIIDKLKKEYVSVSLESKNKMDVLSELSSLFTCGSIEFNHSAMVKTLLEREKLGTTGIGDGIAIPHGKLADLDDIYIAFGKSDAGIPFEAMDSKPVHLFFLLVAPEQSTGQHLKTLAKLSRMLKDAGFRKKLLEAKTIDELYQAIAEKDETC
ncbi:MAG: PTS sugar transporter subunit IIA [Syntrophales bacterium]|jgi:PTS system nitrogen regulatory IIA component|nr:PTS sugar transporter subunit IIA [Syntrophales bacterium]NLN60903.1 PTS sugar transporter subunit IIA [Deltaproteobacteria bacterium]